MARYTFNLEIFIMKFELLFLIVLSYCCVGVVPRTLPSNTITPESFPLRTHKEGKFRPKAVDNVIWTKLERNRPVDVQKLKENNSGADDFNQSSEFTQNNGTNFTATIKSNVDESDKVSLEMESQLTNSNLNVPERVGDQNKERTDNSTIQDVLILNAQNDLSASISDIDSSNSSDKLSTLVNLAGEAVFQSLMDNASTVESFVVDESTVFGEGSEMAFLQEVSTDGFEFLIDSETTQSLILTELLHSQNILNENEEEDFALFHGEVSTSDIVDFELMLIHDTESEVNTTSANEKSANSEIVKFDIDVEATKSGAIVNTSSESDVNAEIVNAQAEASECPEPGWCIFWFFAQDTCAQNSHCHGSLICCKSGCSKTCIDVDT